MKNNFGKEEKTEIRAKKKGNSYYMPNVTEI